MSKVPKNCGINQQKMFEILDEISRDGSQKEKHQTGTDDNEIEKIKQREIDALTVERNTRKIKLTSAQRRNVTQDSDEATSESSGRKITIKDFNMVKLVGKGSFGKVCISILN